MRIYNEKNALSSRLDEIYLALTKGLKVLNLIYFSLLSSVKNVLEPRVTNKTTVKAVLPSIASIIPI